MLLVTARRPAASLTPRELEIVNDLGRGLTVKESAGRRGISVRTAQHQLSTARTRLGARTTPELVALLTRARGEDLRSA